MLFHVRILLAEDNPDNQALGKRILTKAGYQVDVVGTVYDMMLNRAKDIDEIKKALDERNYDKIRILGHSMKGAGGERSFNKRKENEKNFWP